MLTFILLFFVFIFFALRWFKNFNLKGTVSAATISTSATCSWPPIVNLCPDYMVAWTGPAGKVYCYDVANLYGLQTSPTSLAHAMVSGLTINSIEGQSGYYIFNPAGSTSDLANPRYPMINAMASANGPLTDPNAKYLRWEGVWDGQTLNLACIPTADGAKANIPGTASSCS